MAKYIVSFSVLVKERMGHPDDKELKTYTTHSEKVANRLVDEIMAHRDTGIKSSLMLLLEFEHCYEFKQTSGSVVYIDRIEEKRIRAEGGAHATLKRLKAEEAKKEETREERLRRESKEEVLRITLDKNLTPTQRAKQIAEENENLTIALQGR